MGIAILLTCLLGNLYAGQEATVRTGYGTKNCFEIRKKMYVKAECCHLAYLMYMQSTSWKMLVWMNHRLESRLPGEISTTSDMQIISLSWLKMKSLLMRVKEQSEKACLRLSFQKMKIMASRPIT